MLRSITKQGITYLLVGGGTALLELILFQTLNEVFELHIAAANVIAITIATLTNFALNGAVTFKGLKHPWQSLVKYLALFAFNTLFSTTFITIAAQLGVYPSLAKLLTMIVIVIWNFFLYRKFVFV